MLTLPIKKKWFDMIVSGEKKEEYREIKDYYGIRFATYGVGSGEQFEVILRNGYSKKSPYIHCLVECYIRQGNIEWGAEPNKLYYVLTILEISEVKQ